jgi:HPt (histidine-containing phosphotransfer) domain-containing protein
MGQAGSFEAVDVDGVDGVDDLAAGLQLLGADIGEAQLDELIGILRETSLAHLDELRTALAEGDWVAVERLAHSLRASALMVGADALAARLGLAEAMIGRLLRAAGDAGLAAGIITSMQSLSVDFVAMLEGLASARAGR